MKSDEQAAFVVIDNGGSFVRKRVFNKMASLKSLATIMFDPSGKYQDEFQMFSHATLGDGKDVTMHACLKEGNSATLERVFRKMRPLTTRCWRNSLLAA